MQFNSQLYTKICLKIGIIYSYGANEEESDGMKLTRIQFEVLVHVLDSKESLTAALGISREEAERGIAEISETAVNWQAKKRNHCLQVLEAIDNNVPVEEFFEVPQTIQRIGNVAFVGAPFEMFQQTGFLIQKFAKMPYALLLSNTNGTYGVYFATMEELSRGGYEVELFKVARVQPLADHADRAYVSESLRNMEQLTNHQ